MSVQINMTEIGKTFFLVQSEVAQTYCRRVARLAITPEEKQIIEKIPTSSLTAYDFYQQGREELVNYRWSNGNKHR